MKSDGKSGARQRPCAEEKAEQRWSSAKENRCRRGARIFKGAGEGGARGGGGWPGMHGLQRRYCERRRDAPQRSQGAGRLTRGARGREIKFKISSRSNFDLV
jgi:hypothetical protein